MRGDIEQDIGAPAWRESDGTLRARSLERAAVAPPMTVMGDSSLHASLYNRAFGSVQQWVLVCQFRNIESTPVDDRRFIEPVPEVKPNALTRSRMTIPDMNSRGSAA